MVNKLNGEKFGKLTVLKKDQIIKDKAGKSRIFWLCQCDCGTKVKRSKDSLKRSLNPSCGCLKAKIARENGRKGGTQPRNCLGKNFGHLTVIRLLSPQEKSYDSRIWLCQCICGNQVKKSTRQLNRGFGLHCGEKNLYHIPYGLYPAAPIPYPTEAGKIAEKYFYMTKPNYWHKVDFGKYDYFTEEERIDQLLRAAWIITYRRQLGEVFNPKTEKLFINRHLKYCSLNVYNREKRKYGETIN